MERHRTLKRARLANHHLSPGRTMHTIADQKGTRNFPAFVSLEIAQYPSDSGCFLFRNAASGEIADTWHQSIEEAMHQAEYEFGVQPSEWIDASDPVS